MRIKSFYQIIGKLLKEKSKNQPYNSREQRAEFLVKRFNRYIINSVLDVGCSNKYLQKYISNEIKYIGVDISGTPDFKVDLEKDKLSMFKDKNFHVTISIDVLEHLDNIHEIFDELCRVSQKYVIISLPNVIAQFKVSMITGKNDSKFYGLPVDKPLDRHKWFFNYEQALNFIKNRAIKNNFKLKEFFTIPLIPNCLKHQILFFFYKLYYRNRIGFCNLFCNSIWALLERIS